MKKNFFPHFSAAFALIAALVACSKEQPANDSISGEKSGVSFHEVLLIASNASSDAETKAYIESDGAGGFVSKWNDDDQIGLFQKNSVDGYRTKVTSKKADISLSDSDKTASFSVSLAETDGAINYKYWAVYPDNAATRSSDDLNLVIPQTQTFTASMFDKAADVMISEPVERATYSSDALEMGFARVGTIVRMTLKGLTSGETLKSVTFSTTEADKYLAGTVKYDLVNDELKSGISSGKQTLTLTAGESIVVPASGEVNVWFRAAEVTLSDNFTVIAYTRGSDSRNYSYTKVVDLATLGKTLSFRSGRLATFGVTGMNSGKVTLDYEALIPEGYYVLHVINTASSYDKALANTCAGSGFLDALDNPFSDDGNGKYYVSAANLKFLWEVQFDDENNKYSFYSLDSEKFLNGDLNNTSASAVYYYMGSNSEDYAGTYSIYDGSTFASAKHIGYNYNSGDKPRFKFYGAPITNYPGYFTFTPSYSNPIVSYPNVILSGNEEISDPASLLPSKLIFSETIDVEGVYSNAGCTEDADWIVASMADDVSGEINYIVDENTTATLRTAYIKVIALGENASETEMIFTISQPGVIVDATNGDVLWAEAFSGFSNDAVPAASNASTTVYGSRSVTYSCTDGGSTTKIYGSDNNAGGEAPELLISKGNGVFAVSGIPTGNATGMTLSFKMKNGSLSISSSTPSIEIGANIGTSTAPVYSITVPGGTKTVALSFTNTDSKNNTRIDDISLVAGAPSVSTPVISFENNTVTITCGTAGASIYYTDDGTTPDSGKTLYSAAFELTTAKTIKAIAIKAGLNNSEVAELLCTPKVATPVISSSANAFTITCATAGATIYYETSTTDLASVATPTTLSTSYSAAVAYAATTYVKAYAVKDGYTDSDVASATCTYSSGVEPTLQYTLDGTETGGTNGYATESDIEQDEISWKATGNTTMNPWRIGGKVNSGTGALTRAIYSTEPIPATISSIDVTSGEETVNSVNSLTITVHNSAADAAAGTNAIATKTEDTESNITSKTVTLSGGSWTGKYYRIVYNVTVGTSNAYIQFKSAKFYGYDPE